MQESLPERVVERHPSKLIAILLFAAGLVVAALAWLQPSTRQAFEALHRTGYLGAFVGGLLYGFSFTAGTATILFATLPTTQSPVIAAIVGGLGALAYDAAVFTIIRREARGRWHAFLDRLHHRPRLPRWLLVTTACFILASPLPDELAAGFLGLSSVTARQFWVLSYALNTAGLLVIASLG